MNYSDRTYPEIVRDLLTVLTGGTIAEVHSIGPEPPDLIPLDHRPVRRVSHLEGKIAAGEKLLNHTFTERDFELVGTDQNPHQYVALRFRAKGRKPAPNTILTVNYYPERLRPTPLTDISVGSVVRTLLETVSRELATQYQQLQQVYDSAFIETARGGSLDKVAALVDTVRIRQGHPVGKARFSRRSGSPGSVHIPVSTAISDGGGNRYLTSAEITLLPKQSTIEVWIQGEAPNTKPVEAGKLTVLERGIAGIDRVTNDEATYRATEDEPDDQFRVRARRAIHATGKGTPDALRYGLESLAFVSAVTLTEYPDPAVPMPGWVRLDVALSEDSETNRRIVDQRVEELRPAGIYVERQWAGRIALGVHADLVLAGASLATSVLAEVRDGITERITGYISGLGPAGALRVSRLVSLVLQDNRVADAKVTVTADGHPINADGYALPTGKTASLDSGAVSFGEVRFERSASPRDAVLIQLDANLAATSLTIKKDALETALKAALENFLGELSPNTAITFDRIAAALRNDAQFALVRSQSVIGFEQEGGGFTELRDNDPAFVIPAHGTLRVRGVHITEVTT